MLKLAHKDVCVGWGHTGPHRSSLFLQIMQIVEGKIILLKNNRYKLDNIFSWRIQDFPFVQYLPTCIAHSSSCHPTCISTSNHLHPSVSLHLDCLTDACAMRHVEKCSPPRENRRYKRTIITTTR